MPYRLLEIELSRPLQAVQLGDDQEGLGLIARWEDRLVGFLMREWPRGSVISSEALQSLAEKHFGATVLAHRLEQGLRRCWTPPAPAGVAPSLSIAICTKDRAVRLKRLLASLDAIRSGSGFRSVEILVVDNASVDASTRQAAESFANVRYIFEPCTGLDFARNAALRNASGEWLAYLDDDVVVDRHWLQGLFEVWSDHPDAGGFSGLVLPYRLDSDAQVYFEAHGGFGRGFRRSVFGQTRLGNPLHPVGAGIIGAGCNMCFDRRLLLELGGFDEALDTGAPLPGGGDLDIFYRVLRAGRRIVYEPRYAVYHEHRETLQQLRRQYWSWGLGFMAFLSKARRTDRPLLAKHGAMLRWWFGDKCAALLSSARRLEGRRLAFTAAELWGGVMGLLGEYERSQARVHLIRSRAP